MQCINCGNKISEDEINCKYCGKYQPLTTPSTKPVKKTFFDSLSIIFFVIALCLLPLILIAISLLVGFGILSEASTIDVITHVFKIILYVCFPPLALALLFKILSK